MIQRWELAQLSSVERERIMRRAETDIRDLLPLAQRVIDRIGEEGDAALIEFAREFDSYPHEAENLRATEEDFAKARESIGPEVIDAIKQAYENIRRFHEEQMPEPMWFTEVRPGIMAGEKITPIPSVGLSVPGRKGTFPSVMLMLGVPAKVAGVGRIVVVTPPSLDDGKPDAATLVAAEVCGIDEVYALGGIQAMAALAQGTATIPQVDKIVGPGSAYTTAAKHILSDRLDVGLPAGPSESIILCDEHVDARLAALDLLVEAEHGPDSAALLVTHSQDLADKIEEILPNYIAELPEWRQDFVRTVLSNYGGLMLTNNLDESVGFVNDYAPEHLEVLTEEPFITLNKIKNAGEILLGPMTPIPTANYCLGLNAILPTGGFARSYSSVSVFEFLKRSGVGYLSKEGYQQLANITTTLADYEGFPAHAFAIRKRNELLGL